MSAVEYEVNTFERDEATEFTDENWAYVQVSQVRRSLKTDGPRRVYSDSTVYIPAQDLVTLRDALTKEIRSARRRGLIS